MKSKFLQVRKMLLVAAGLLVGASTWADSVTATLVHTASSSRDGSNNITTTVDQEFEHYNNTKAAAWGGWAYAEFSFEIPEGQSISKATLTWNTKIGGNSNNRNNDIYYLTIGTTIAYEGLESTTDLNLDGEFIINEVVKGPTDRTQVTTDVTTAMRAVAESQKYIIFKWTNNAAGADLYGKGSDDYAPTLVIETTTETFYTATFTEATGLEPSVTIYIGEDRATTIQNGSLSANTTYYYTATLAGYEDYNGEFAVEASDPVVNFTMTTKPRYTFTINLVNSNGGTIIQSIYTDEDSYDGKEHKVGLSKYLTDESNRVTYSKDDDTYYYNYVSASDKATQTVPYTAYNGIAYFFEGESFTWLGTNVENGNYSGNTGGRGLSGTQDIVTIPTAGIYKLTSAICNNNVNQNISFAFYKNDSENVIQEIKDITYPSATQVKTDGTRVVDDIEFAAGDVLQFYASSTNVILDYVLLECNSITGTIATSGYSTLASAYGLDFANAEGLTAAYVVTEITSDAVKLEEVNELPANNGVILMGDGGASYSIPVKADATFEGTNLLKAAVEATPINANEAYILQGGLFHLVAAESTVPAGKAYLLKEDVSAEARTLSLLFGGETTGIAEVEKADAENGAIYNLSGQRVSKPASGLYIMNNKKVVIK